MPQRALTEPWWTPWPGTGPGHDLLGDVTGLTVVELGCGKGDNAAALVAAGAKVTGVDYDPAKIAHAGRRWHGARRLQFEHAEATARLASLAAPVDVVCSIFGALSFTPARPLLGHIARSLCPGGRLVIAARTPGQATPPDQRYAAWEPHARSANAWSLLLAACDLSVTTSLVFDHPTDPDASGCVVLVARRESPMANDSSE